jgi:hypothetical protein
MGHIIFTAKLLEGFILATEEHGLEIRTAAFQAAENLLEQLNLNNKNKEQQFCVNLEPELYCWLSQEAVRLQLRIIPLIRKIIEEMTLKEPDVNHQHLDSKQKVGIEYQLMTYKLLEALVNKTVEDGELLIEEARSKTKNMLLKLFPEKQLYSLAAT